MKRRKLMAMGLAMLLITSVLAAGCQKSTDTETDSNPAGTQSPKSTEAAAAPEQSKEKYEIEAAEISWGTNLPAGDQDFVKQELDKKLNIDLQIFSVASQEDYVNQLNVRIASGDYPDLFQVNDRSNLIQYAKTGALLDLTPYMDKLQDYSKFVGEDTIKKGSYNGKIYALPQVPGGSFSSTWIRKDWLETLNLSVPTTIDELFDVARAFTENDPDGNNKKDTFGFSGQKLETFRAVFGGYGVAWDMNLFIKDKQLKASAYEPAMKDALTTVKKFIDAGVVDPDFLINDGPMVQQKAIQGKVGIVALGWDLMDKDQAREQIKAVNPNAQWIPIPTVAGPVGTYERTYDIGAAGTMFVIPAALEKEPEKLERVFELLNYVSSEEGNRLVQFGIEGRHYNMVDGKVVATDLMAKEANFTWLYQFTGRPGMTYLQTKFPAQAESIKFSSERPVLETVDGFVDIPESFNMADAKKYYQEEITKFIYGEEPIDKYDDFVNTLNTTYGYSDFVKNATEQIDKLGLLK